MKLLAFLLSVACVAAHVHEPEANCQNKIMKPGMEYEYEYHGRLLTGLPFLSSQYSGLGMRATIKVFAKTSSVLVLQVEQPKYVDVNQVLYPKERGADTSYKNDGWDWKNLYLPPLKPMPSQYAQILSKPVEFIMACDGAVREVVVSQDEPEWSLNFKKALIALFQSTVDTYSIELEQNRIQHPSEQNRVAWKVKEDSLQGKCENTYQVNELPEYLITEKPELIPLPSKCPTNPNERRYFEISQTRDLNSCERPAQFNFFRPGQIKNEASSKISVTRYIVCAAINPSNMGSTTSGMSKALRATNMVLQKVVNVHEQSQNMMGFNSERFVSGTKQILMLRRIQQVQKNPTVSQPIKLFNLMYEYKGIRGPLQAGHLGSGAFGGANGMTGDFLAKISPKSGLNGGVESSSIPFDDTAVQIKKLLKEVVDAILASEKSGFTEEANKSNINLKLMSIVRGFWRAQHSDQLTKLLEQMESAASSQQYRQTLRNYFVDTLGMAGTPESVRAILHLIEQGKLSQYQIANFLIWMPTNIIYPQERLLEDIFRVVRSQRVQAQTLTRNLAITSFTQLLQKACIAEDRKMMYPTFVVGEFCDANSRIVQNEWLPYLHGSLASAQNANDRNIFLVALGVLQQQQTIRELIPYVTGTLRTQAGVEVTDLNRLMATYALANIGQTQPNVVVPVLMTVFSNPTESTEIRIAAFNTLLRMNPSPSVFQRIAAITLQEEAMDSELLKVINIALYSIGNEMQTSNMEIQLGEFNHDLINKARMTFHLIRKVNGILPTTGTIYTTDFLKRIGVGYDGFIAYVASEASVLPKSMYTEIRYALDQHSVLGLMMGYRLSGSENLYQKLGDTLLKGMKGEDMASFGGMNGQSIDSKMSASFVLQFFENAALFFSTEDLTTESIAEKMMPYLKNPALLKQKFGDMQNLHAQRTYNLAQMAVTVPSDMGFPINIIFDTPMTIAVSGKINPKAEAVSPKLEMSGKFIFTSQYIATVGTTVPFSKEIVLTGVNQHTVVNIPGAIDIEMNIPAHKLSVMVKPHQQVTTPVDMIHFHRYPFTVSQRAADLTPFSEQPNMKQIRSQTPLRTSEAEFGELLGLKMKAKIETESHYVDTASILDIFKMYKYNPLNVMTFFWTIPALSKTSSPSVRRTSLSVIYDPTQSSTKEIGFELRIGVGSKTSGEASSKYHMVHVKSGSGLSGAGSNVHAGKWAELVKKLSPYELAEKPLGGSAAHPRREQKLKAMLDGVSQSSDVAGVTLQMTAIIKGNRPRTWTSALTIVGGATNENNGSINKIWDINLERSSSTPDSPKHVCAKGKVTLPILPIWNTHELHVKPIDVQFYNKLSMGLNSCNEASILTSGNAKVSEAQKRFSRESFESKKCEDMVQNGKMTAKSFKYCKMANYQARTIDTVEVANKFTHVPEYVKTWEQRLTTFAKIYLWPFTTGVQGRSEVVAADNFNTHLKFQFQKWTRGVDMTISRPQEELVFSNVRIPYPLSLFAPLKAGSNNFRLASEKMTPGGSQMECTLERNSIEKFNGHAFPYNVDDTCYHVLATDIRTFTVSAKKRMDQGQTRYDAKIEYNNEKQQGVALILEFPLNGQPKVTVEVAGNPTKDITLVNNKLYNLPNYATVINSGGSFVYLNIPGVGDFSYDGKAIWMEINKVNSGHLIGLCGNSNLIMKGGEHSGINTCTYTKPLLEIASHRVQTASCPQLEGSVEAELKKEMAKCHGENVMSESMKLKANALFLTCVLHKNTIISFNKNFVRFPSDGSYHLLARDGTDQTSSFEVFTKRVFMSGNRELDIKVQLGNKSILMKYSHRQMAARFINEHGQEIPIEIRSGKPVRVPGTNIAIFHSPSRGLVIDGNAWGIKIESEDQMRVWANDGLKNQLNGLCERPKASTFGEKIFTTGGLKPSHFGARPY